MSAALVDDITDADTVPSAGAGHMATEAVAVDENEGGTLRLKQSLMRTMEVWKSKGMISTKTTKMRRKTW